MFGKRKLQPVGNADKHPVPMPRHPGPDADGVARVLPKNLWKGPQGKMLREAGIQPDDPNNLVLTRELLEARMDAALAEQNRFMAELNTNLQAVAPGVSVIPWAMIPWSVWNSPAQRLLAVTCKYYPAGLWNCFLMPADEQSAYALSMPVHPRRKIPGVAENCIRLLVELDGQHRAVFDKTQSGLSRGDYKCLAEYQNSVDECLRKVLLLARAITADVFGQAVYDRHKQLFGRNLAW